MFTLVNFLLDFQIVTTQQPQTVKPAGPTLFKVMVEKEIDSYWNCSPPKAIVGPDGKKFMPSPFLFWIEQAVMYPSLSKIAFSILATTATSGGSEREFSNAGWLGSGRRNKLSEKNLASEVFLSCNKNILRKYF